MMNPTFTISRRSFDLGDAVVSFFTPKGRLITMGLVTLPGWDKQDLTNTWTLEKKLRCTRPWRKCSLSCHLGTHRDHSSLCSIQDYHATWGRLNQVCLLCETLLKPLLMIRTTSSKIRRLIPFTWWDTIKILTPLMLWAVVTMVPDVLTCRQLMKEIISIVASRGLFLSVGNYCYIHSILMFSPFFVLVTFFCLLRKGLWYNGNIWCFSILSCGD